MKPAKRSQKTQLCRVGNYQMTGKLLGKGHFARVEEATHRLLGKTCGSRLYLVMEACGGGDLCSLVLQQRNGTRGLPESRARRLAAHLVSAVRHMHACGAVHRWVVRRRRPVLAGAAAAERHARAAGEPRPPPRRAPRVGRGTHARVRRGTQVVRAAAETCASWCCSSGAARAGCRRAAPAASPRTSCRPCDTCTRAARYTGGSCGGGVLFSLVLQQRSGTRGLPESRTRRLAAHLVSAVRHMHACGAVHRDLKMENIMLDITKQNIKIVDFGLSNVWQTGTALNTPCGSLEYAAPELFLDGRRYGPEVDLWSVGVIVYGMVTGTLPFTLPAERAPAKGGGDRPLFSQVIARGFGRKQHLALAHVSSECRDFIKMLLQPEPRLRLPAARAAAEPWLRRSAQQLPRALDSALDSAAAGLIYKQIADVSGLSVTEVAAQIRTEPYGPLGGMYNIESHRRQLRAGRPHTAQPTSLAPPPSPPPTPALADREDPRLGNRTYLTSKSLDKKVERRLPCITESQATIETRPDRGGVKAVASRVRTCVRRPSPRTETEQIGKYRAAAAPTTTSKLKDFYQRAGDCIPGCKNDYVDPSYLYRRVNAGNLNTTVVKRTSVGYDRNITSPSSSYGRSITKSEDVESVNWTKPKETQNAYRFRRVTPSDKRGAMVN